RAKRDLAVRGLGLEPLRDRLEVLLRDRAAILVAQEVLEQDLEGEGKAGNTLEPVLFRGREAVIGVGLAADLERFAAPETVERSHPLFFRCLAGGIILPSGGPLASSAADRSGCGAMAYRSFFRSVPENRRRRAKCSRSGWTCGFDTNVLSSDSSLSSDCLTTCTSAVSRPW